MSSSVEVRGVRGVTVKDAACDDDSEKSSKGEWPKGVKKKNTYCICYHTLLV